MKQFKTVTVLFILANTLPAAAANLSVGDPAPALSIDTWVQGDPVDLKKDKGKRIYMVEFWATWCPPCKISVPVLTDLQNKYKNDLTIIGVTAADPRNTTKDVKRFVKKRGDEMPYSVAMDKDEKTTMAYLAAAGVDGIPYSFLVDKKGLIAWHGSPLDPAIGDVIAQLVSGSFDAESARKQADLQAEVNRRFQEVYLYIQVEQWSRVWDALVGILKVDPGNIEAMDVLMQVYLSDKREKKVFRKWVESHIGAHGQDVEVMQRLARILCANPDVPKRVPDLALNAARASYEASKKQDALAVSTYALAVYQIGDLERAIALQREAVSVATDANGDMVRETLDFYTQCMKLQQLSQ